MQRTAEQRAQHVAWMRQVADGDPDVFELLYDEFVDLTFSIALGMLRDRQRAEDATQDVWIKVWNAASTYDADKASVATWITTLAHRHMIDMIRRANARPGDRPGLEAGDEVAARLSNSDDVAEDATNRAYAADVREAMSELTGDQRTAIELAYFDGLTQSEIAERLQKPLGTIKTYMFQGMRRLRETLGVETDMTTGSQGEPRA
ncbi:MAG: polymerase sigma-70 factor [Thermoleophilia bacterium]|nr:polymerase sigma-70 factor [Thermoleophilia bacterium]